MKTASGALIALLNSTGAAFLMADLYTFTLIDGTLLRYTSYDKNLVVGGNTFTSTTIKRGTTSVKRGVEVDTLDVSIFPSTVIAVGAVPILQAINLGYLDGATLLLERVFMATPGDTSAGTVKLFLGRVADTELNRLEAKLTLKSHLELLNVKMPRNVYQKQCIHTQYDAACGLNKSSFGVTGNLTSGSTKTALKNAVTQAVGYFDLGTILFTAGVNINVTRTIKSHTAGIFSLMSPLPFTPGATDAFTATPNCGRLQAACGGSVFNNLVHFRGYPYIPAPETAY